MDLAVRSGGPEILLHRGRPVWKDLRHLGSRGVVSNAFFSAAGSLLHFHPVPGSAALVFFLVFFSFLFFHSSFSDLAMYPFDAEH